MAGLAMRITDRAGNLVGLQTTVAGLFGIAPPLYDRAPRVIYDSLHGRFVATELTWDCVGDAQAQFGHGYIDLAVSETTDPHGLWDFYFWTYDDLVPEGPSIGTSTDKLAITSSVYQMSTGGGSSGMDCADPNVLASHPFASDILITNWADAVAHKTATLRSTEQASLVANPGATFGVRAALQAPATSANLYVVGRVVTGAPVMAGDPFSGYLPNDVVVTMFSGLTTATASVTASGNWNLTQDSIIAGFADPAPPSQPGPPNTIVKAVDGDVHDALWQSGRLSWASTYPCTPSGDGSVRDCVRVSQVATPAGLAEPTASQDFTVGRNGFDSYMPGIGFSADGTLELVYSQSSSSSPNYPSSWQRYQRATDPANSLSPAVLLQAGTGTYPGLRWGTYVGLGQDPQVASAVWQANAYSAGAAYWSTFVDQLGRTTGSTYRPITPTRIVDSRDGSGLSGLVNKFVSTTARTFQVAGLGGILGNAVAITGNVTVTRQNAAGYVAVTPLPHNNPTSSTLNFPLGDTRANNVTVPLAADGSLSMTYVASPGRTTDLILDVTGYFVPDDSAATYHPLSPTRLLNSVSGIGQPMGLPTPFVAGLPQTFTIGTGSPIPLAASAITGNLTVTNQSKAGYLSITPDPTTMPLSSSLNFPLGDNRANGFTAPLNASHQLSIVYSALTGATTDVILDVTGYYLPDLSGLHFFPLNPGRVLDSRPGVANSGLTGLFASATPLSLSAGGHWGIPSGAMAISANLTVVNQTTRGYVAATLTADPNPATSTLNFPLGDIRANGLTVPLDGSGDLFLVFKGTSPAARTNLILDVSGYFQ